MTACSGDEAAVAGGFRTAVVERGDLVVQVTATGTLQPVTQVQVGTQVTGTVAALFADFNSTVKQGQVVAQIDPAPFEARVASDRANVVRAEADLVRVQALLRQAEADYTRQATLVKDGLVTESEFEAAVANRDSLLAQVQVARASIAQQEAALTISEVNLQYTTIISPVDGTVISRNVDVGQTVSASLSAPTIFVIGADLERMQVQAAVAEADIGRIADGQPVGFAVDAYPGERFAGQVEQVRLAPTIVQNVVTYTVIVDAPNPGGRLLPGMTANLEFEIERLDGVLLVPDSALRFTPPGEAPAKPGTRRVFVVEDGAAKAVAVETGPSDGIRSAVLGGALVEGAAVATGLSMAGSGPAVTNPFAPPRMPTGGGRTRP
ncbi:MAG: efflux RND transporter periplasmic adaptor subunit [Planctomycetota bacterium]